MTVLRVREDTARKRAGSCEGRGAEIAKSVGIDFGTTDSVVAVVEGGKPMVIVNAEGRYRCDRSRLS